MKKTISFMLLLFITTFLAPFAVKAVTDSNKLVV